MMLQQKENVNKDIQCINRNQVEVMKLKSIMTKI